MKSNELSIAKYISIIHTHIYIGRYIFAGIKGFLPFANIVLFNKILNQNQACVCTFLRLWSGYLLTLREV